MASKEEVVWALELPMGENGFELLCSCSLPLEIRADFPDTNDFYCDSLLLLQRDKDPHEV